MNKIVENNYKSAEPEVGMGATELLFSDRHAYTIIAIVDKDCIVVQRDKAIRTDGRGMSDMQKYEYTANPAGETRVLHRCADGHWREGAYTRPRKTYPGNVFMLGRRDEHYDYSF